MQGDEVHDFAVNKNWSLADLCEYLVLRISLTGNYTFVVDNNSVRKRAEKSVFCKGIQFPRCILIHEN